MPVGVTFGSAAYESNKAVQATANSAKVAPKIGAACRQQQLAALS